MSPSPATLATQPQHDACALDALDAVRAACNLSDTRLLVDDALHPPGDDDPAGAHAPRASGRALLARASGLSLAGVRVAALLDGPWDATASLSAVAGRHLPLVTHLVGRAAVRHGRTRGAGHDALPSIASSGAFVLASRSPQDAADLSLLATRLAELCLLPGVVHHDPGPDDAPPVLLPPAEAVRAWLGSAGDALGAPTPAQSALFGGARRHVPRVVDPDAPTATGGMLDGAAYARGAVADEVYFGESLAELSERACRELAALTRRPMLPVLTHRMADAEFVLVTTGSLAPLAELVADHARLVLRVRVGVVAPILVHPLPANRLVTLLAGKKGVAVLERDGARGEDDPPLLASLRAAFARAVERGRGKHHRDGGLRPDEVPTFLPVTCGVGGCEPTPAHLLAVVDRLRRRDGDLRRVVLGVELLRPRTTSPKLQLWQERLLDARPDLGERALPPLDDDDVLPRDALVLRVHAVGQGSAGRDLGARLAAQLGRALQRRTRTFRDGSPERIGLPLVTRALLTPSPVPHLAPPRHTDVVLHAAPWSAHPDELLAGLADGGVLLLEDGREPAALWAALPRRVQRAVRERRLRLLSIDTRAHADARDDVLLRALLGAVTASAACEGLHQVPLAEETGPDVGSVPGRPQALDDARPEGPAHGGRFWERVGHLVAAGETPLADPVAALGALPAGSSALRDPSRGRAGLPRLDTTRCSACGECWTACPDAAFDVRVTDAEALLRAAAQASAASRPDDRLAPLLAPLGQTLRKLLAAGKADSPAAAIDAAWDALRTRLPLDEQRQAEVRRELDALIARLEGHPFVRGASCLVEAARHDLLSLCVDPSACKACGLCIEICPEDALDLAPQDEAVLAHAHAALQLAAGLPDDPTGRVDDSPAGRLLRRDPSTTPVGGDAACAGCGEKSALRLVMGAVAAEMGPRVRAHVAELEDLHARLHARARDLVSGGVDLAHLNATDGVRLHDDVAARVGRLSATAASLAALLARYDAGRAGAQLVGSSGCSLRIASSFPCAPFPVPWTAQLLEDGPDVALGLHEGLLAGMADGFAVVRRARALLADDEAPVAAPPSFDDLEPDELALCPPVVLVGGDRGLGETAIGRVNALLTSGRPVRVVLLDNQLGADCGARPTRARDDLSWLALARRDVFVLRSTPGHPAHLLDGLRRALRSRHPSLCVLYAPCPLEHGHAPHESVRAAHLAVASRAFPLLVHDPDGGAHLAERLDLSANPAPDALLGTMDDGAPASFGDVAASEARFAHLLHPLEPGAEKDVVPLHELLALPREARNGRRASVTNRAGRRLLVEEALVRHADELLAHWELLRELAGCSPSPAVLERTSRGARDEASRRIDALRREHAAELRDVRRSIPQVVARRLAEGLLRAGRGRTVDEILSEAADAGGLAPVDLDALLETPAATRADGAATATHAPDAPLDAARENASVPDGAAANGAAGASAGTATDAPTADASAVNGAESTADVPPDDDDVAIALDPYIDSIRCTTCNECVNLNGRMFAYDGKKRAYVKDAAAGTFAQLVQAAEKCPVAIIHPGTPRNPDEKNLDALVERARRFQ